MESQVQKYPVVTRAFHWFSGPIVIAMLVIGFIMTRLEASDLRWELYGLHKATGFVLLWLMLLRLVGRLAVRTPGLPSHLPEWQQVAARCNIAFQYFCLVMMPLTGSAMTLLSGRDINVFDLFTVSAVSANRPLGPWPHDIHLWLSYALAGSVVVHVCAAGYHHFYLRDKVLRRIT